MTARSGSSFSFEMVFVSLLEDLALMKLAVYSVRIPVTTFCVLILIAVTKIPTLRYQLLWSQNECFVFCFFPDFPWVILVTVAVTILIISESVSDRSDDWLIVELDHEE